MRARENTVQQLDPLAALGFRPLSIIAGAVTVVYAVAMTWFDRNEIVRTDLAIAALVALGVAATFVALSASPLRPPFSARTFAVVVAAAVLAMALSAFSMWGSNSTLRFDWGPVAIGLAIVSLSSFRPPRDLAAAAVFAGIAGTVLAVAQAPFVTTGDPVLVTVVIAITPILAIPLAAAGFATVMVGTLVRWQSRATFSALARVDDSREAITRSVQQDRVTILNRDVVPFLAGVIERGTVTDVDRARALEISDTIRSVMVADVDRSWLDGVVERAIAATTGDPRVGSESVQDDDRLAVLMNTDQRTAIRAIIGAIFGHPGSDPDGFSIVILPAGRECEVTLRARIDAGDHVIRSEIFPYLSVLGVVFGGLRVEVDQPALTLRFSYVQR